MRLIDADTLVQKKRIGTIGNISGDFVAGFDIDTSPTIDAVPVVRCRECKHFNLITHECENELLSTDHEDGASYSLNFYDDDFCSYGQRKEDDHEVS